MKLFKAHVTNYRSIIDSGEFEIDHLKTILVGPNEAGKTAILQALQHLNPPEGAKKLSPLRDYPRSKYNEITQGDVDPEYTKVVKAEFVLEEADKKILPEDFQKVTYSLWRNLDNSIGHCLNNAPESKKLSSIKKDLIRLAKHADKKHITEENEEQLSPTDELSQIIDQWYDWHIIKGDKAKKLNDWLDNILQFIDEDNEKEEKRFDQIKYDLSIGATRTHIAQELRKKVPLFVLFSNYFRVRPLIHLKQLANRIENGTLDDERFDYGNVCLLNLLGFDAEELSQMGNANDPDINDPESLEKFRERLDERQYQLNAAEVKLTKEILSIWNPNLEKGEAAKLKIRADGQYLKITVEDDLGVEVELDQRSEGFQWLVSFFIVFFAEAQGVHKNAILLLDEPGMSLHALKQKEFRKTISRLAEKNQTLYSTHSPFLVGSNEIDLVRVVEMKNRELGTKVHTSITASDPAALLPLQEALGYDLAQSLFTQKKNLILEGLTDYWYVDAMSCLLSGSKKVHLDNNIALVPSNTASKVTYFATILHAQGLKVAALLDSDNAGDQAAQQDTLVYTLKNKRIFRTKDYYTGNVTKPEIEDLLRETLIKVAKDQLNWDVKEAADKQKTRSIVKIFEAEIKTFSKYILAKSFIKWSRDNALESLQKIEIENWEKMFDAMNKSLK